jgi:hypothetical protein
MEQWEPGAMSHRKEAIPVQRSYLKEYLEEMLTVCEIVDQGPMPRGARSSVN